jgi:hypothetical protein
MHIKPASYGAYLLKGPTTFKGIGGIDLIGWHTHSNFDAFPSFLQSFCNASIPPEEYTGK